MKLNKSTPIPPKVIPGKYSKKFTTFSCRMCGCNIGEAWIRYCPNCGQAVLHANNCGACGWNKEDADAKFNEVVKSRGKK